MATSKVRLLVNTKGAKRGDEIEVDSSVVSDLVANRQAVKVSAKKSADKS